MPKPTDTHRFQELFQKYIQSDSTGDLLFFQSESQNITYKKFCQNVYGLSELLKNHSAAFFAIKLNDPVAVYSYVVATLLARKKLVLLSPLEPAAASESHRESLAWDLLIDDHKALQQSQEINLKTAEINIGDLDEDYPFLYVLSSGSSGKPKGIGHSLFTLSHSAVALIKILKMKQKEISLLNLPVSHVGGLMIFWRAFFSGGAVSTKLVRFDYVSLVPLQLERWLQNSEKRLLLKQSKAILIGGAILSKELRQRADSEGLHFFETYGMTETASLVMLNGSPLEGQIIKLNSDHLILIKGPTLAPELSLTKDGFYQTADIGCELADGRIAFVERADINFKSAGELIHASAVETAIKSIHDVKEAVLVAVPHPVWDAAGCLFYECEEGQALTPGSIRESCQTIMHPYQIPKYIFEHQFSLSTLKPSRFQLKKLAVKKTIVEKFHHQFVSSQQNQIRLVVFLHGFMGDMADLKSLYPESFDHNHTSVLFLDLPGHGKTSCDSFENRKDVFFALSELIRFYADGKDILLYGYSMGGRIALELAACHLPVKKCIVESASFGLLSKDEKEKRLQTDMSLFSKKPFVLDDFFKSWYQNPLFYQYNLTPDYQSDLLIKMKHDFLQWEKSLSFFSQGHGLLAEELMGLLKKNHLSLVVIAGEKDEKYCDHFQWVGSQLDIKYFEISESGHNPHKINLSQVISILKSELA